jgi:hypothetical protein
LRCSLAKFTDTHEHYQPDEIEFDEEDLTEENDPFGFARGDIKGQRTARTKELKELRKNWTPCYTIVKSLLSPEIETRIKELPGYANAAGTYDPLMIYLLSLEAATGNGPAEQSDLSCFVKRPVQFGQEGRGERELIGFPRKIHLCAGSDERR